MPQVDLMDKLKLLKIRLCALMQNLRQQDDGWNFHERRVSFKEKCLATRHKKILHCLNNVIPIFSQCPYLYVSANAKKRIGVLTSD